MRITNLDPMGSSPEELRAAGKVLKRVAWIVAILLLILVVVPSVVGPYSDYLWYVNDVRRPQVPLIGYEAKGQLLLISFLLAWALLYFSLKRAFAMSMIYLQTPSSMGQQLVTGALHWVRDSGANLIRYLSPVLAFLTALGFSDEWNTWLLARHAQTFGVTDPLFHKDLGFYVFTLPWYRAISNFAFGLLLETLVLTAGVYIGLQVLAAMAKVELNRPQVRVHLSLLAGVTVLALAAQVGLKCYEYGLVDSGQFTGAGYTAARQLVVQEALAWLLAALGIGICIGAKWGRPYMMAARGAGALAVIYVLGMLIYPFAVQRLVVEPDRLKREAPYAARAIQMTRYAYGLDGMDDRPFDVQLAPTAADVADSRPTIDDMRLWDPEVMRQAFDKLEGIKTYYAFRDVDIDRYTVDGTQQMVMLSPRDMRLGGLDPRNQYWLNERLQYTHGFGVVIAPVNQAGDDGNPVFWADHLPQTSIPDIPITQPRIYFSDFQDDEGNAEDPYALVDTSQAESDYPMGDKLVPYAWQGTRGIPIGGLMMRLLYSLKLGDGNLLISNLITDQSKLLIHRNVRDRASMVLPFLKFDQDPYIVVLDGRVIWVLDGYTTSDEIPYSAETQGDAASLNYIRNSVKVTVDAYTGEVHAYAVLPDEPILRAYRAIYPGLIQDASQMPAGLAAHLRYPEDLFTVQAFQLQEYHVEDPTIFLNNGDAWSLPYERGLSGARDLMRPYFVQMKLPDEAKPGFVLMLPFTPLGKGTLSGWMCAQCDPGVYGKLVLYRYPQGTPVNGPELEESAFNQDPNVSNMNRQFSNEQSEIVVGNLLVMPIGKSLMYVEPVFLRSRTAGMQAPPELQEVILATNDKIVVRHTYQDALQALFGNGGGGEAPPGANQPPNGATPSAPPSTAGGSAGAKDALKLMDEADAALRAGDFGKYGQLQKQLRAKLKQLAGSQ